MYFDSLEKQHYEGTIPDRIYYQLCDKDPQECYAEQRRKNILMAQEQIAKLQRKKAEEKEQKEMEKKIEKDLEKIVEKTLEELLKDFK